MSIPDKQSQIRVACEEVEAAFKSNLSSVEVLIDFDDLLLEFVLKSVRDLVGRLKSDHGIGNPRLTGEATFKQLENIKSNGSLTPSYEQIYNSCLVLLVSYFGSAVAELFRRAVREIIVAEEDVKFGNDEIKFSIEELKELDFNIANAIGNIIVQKNEISFQDMQSIQRAFKKYFDVEIAKDANVNNIILAQACRHSIVHSGSIFEKKSFRQVSSAKPREVKADIRENEKVKFNKEELDRVMESMTEYLKNLTNLVLKRHG